MNVMQTSYVPKSFKFCFALQHMFEAKVFNIPFHSERFSHIYISILYFKGSQFENSENIMHFFPEDIFHLCKQREP